ncbi:MAG: glycoside hydrolase family 9 protein [Bacteroidales bacterium]|nr:glycoside hydrolase family 9 protein [Bacteroidales bacterium]
MKKSAILLAAGAMALALFSCTNSGSQKMTLNELEYFEETGVNVLVYSNAYQGIFCDEKLAGIEIIQRGERIGTGGGIRLMNTPEQWDVYGAMAAREVNRSENFIEVELTYADYDFVSKIRVSPKDKGVLMQVYLDKPVPSVLEGKAGMNLEFFPASYFGKNYLVDGQARILPKYPQHDTKVLPVSEKIPQFFGESTFDDRGRGEFLMPLPLSTGSRIVLAPEDDNLCVAVESDAPLNLYDGRLLAQNGTFVLRSLLPAGKSGKVLEWYVEPKCDPEWIRKPNIGISQIGYAPGRSKVAVLELDRRDKTAATAKILRINADGTTTVAKTAKVEEWGVFNKRYKYARIDFSDVRESGLYKIEYKGVETNAFPIDKDVYGDKWHASMDIALVVNMDHIQVNEGYRVWHGCANMDDAIMAPANISIHDGYRQGPENFTKYKPLEHVPGIAVGGWYDAGDFDLQQNSVVNTVMDLATLWRMFRPERDMTYIDEQTRYADIHRPDGVPDVVQQIMHGTLNINAQVEALGFVAGNIGQPQMHQYHHLGDAVNLTDGLIYDPKLKPYEVSADGKRSGTYDDRIIMTARPTAASVMNTIVALASAYPALREYFPKEAERSLKNALMLWDKYVEGLNDEDVEKSEGPWWARDEKNHRLRGAIELYYATGGNKYRDIITEEILNRIDPRTVRRNAAFGSSMIPALNLAPAIRVYDILDEQTREKIDEAIPAYVAALDSVGMENPYRVPIVGYGWGGNNQVISNALSAYTIWKRYPDKVNPEIVFRAMDYLFGTHPYHNKSFITGVGVRTKDVGYGNNRADYTVIPGGVIPGLLLRKPDFMENKDDYPFLWGENECCINSVPNYVMLNLACIEMAAGL